MLKTAPLTNSKKSLMHALFSSADYYLRLIESVVLPTLSRLHLPLCYVVKYGVLARSELIMLSFEQTKLTGDAFVDGSRLATRHDFTSRHASLNSGSQTFFGVCILFLAFQPASI